MDRTGKVLIIVRHAHRDTSDRRRDNGLTAKGQKQAQRVLRHYKRRFDRREALIFSSSKKRCMETVQPLARHLRAVVRKDARLMELRQGESAHDFTIRIKRFFVWWLRQGPELTVVCSHGDWIPTAVKIAVGAEIELKKGGWLEMETRNGACRLTWMLQSLK